MLCYADDVAIFFHGATNLERIIKNLEDWASENEMIINKKKSGILFIKKKENNKMRS